MTATTRRSFLKVVGSVAASHSLAGCTALESQKVAHRRKRPNIVFIMVDDMGYGDAGCYGGSIDTPHLDQMAQEGMLFTDFHSNGPLCTPTRAALLTGKYQQRVGMIIAGSERYTQVKTMPREEVTFAEILKKVEYQTTLVGKWHLGDHSPYLPIYQGFDLHMGLPYSNDMNPWTPRRVERPDLPYMLQEHHIEYNPNQDYLTRRYTFESLHFIEKNKDRPFMLYLSHAMPHHPIHASKFFTEDRYTEEQWEQVDKDHPLQTETRLFLYDACIEELDWSTGKVLDKIRELGLEKDTLVIFTSDNGPGVPDSTGPLRGRKGSLYEGGHRMPFIAWWPGRIPAGTVSHEVAMSMDMMPTMAELTGAPLPNEKLDGRSIVPVLLENKTLPQRDTFMRVRNRRYVRVGPWKLHVTGRGDDYYGKIELYNLDDDISESKDVSERYPQRVKEMIAKLDSWEAYVDVDGPLEQEW